MTDKRREVLVEFWRDCQGTSMYPNKAGDKLIDQAITALDKIALHEQEAKEELCKCTYPRDINTPWCDQCGKRHKPKQLPGLPCAIMHDHDIVANLADVTAAVNMLREYLKARE